MARLKGRAAREKTARERKEKELIKNYQREGRSYTSEQAKLFAKSDVNREQMIKANKAVSGTDFEKFIKMSRRYQSIYPQKFEGIDLDTITEEEFNERFVPEHWEGIKDMNIEISPVQAFTSRYWGINDYVMDTAYKNLIIQIDEHKTGNGIDLNGIDNKYSINADWKNRDFFNSHITQALKLLRRFYESDEDYDLIYSG